MAIPGRVGYQCSNYYRKLIKDNVVTQHRYVFDADGKMHHLSRKEEKLRGSPGSGEPRKRKTPEAKKSSKGKPKRGKKKCADEIRAWCVLLVAGMFCFFLHTHILQLVGGDVFVHALTATCRTNQTRGQRTRDRLSSPENGLRRDPKLMRQTLLENRKVCVCVCVCFAVEEYGA